MKRRRSRLAFQVIPESGDVLPNRRRRGRLSQIERGLRQVEVLFYKVFQRRAGSWFLRVVQLKDFRWRGSRNSVGELLAVGKDVLHFHRSIKVFEQDLGRIGILLGLGARRES